MKQIEPAVAAAVVQAVYAITNPVKPHEAKTIADILVTKEPQHEWRFKSHIFCSGCRREMTVLDMFLTGLAHHTPEFIREYIYGDKQRGGDLVFEDGKHPSIRVFKHGISVTCMICGVVNESQHPSKCDYYCYKKPGGRVRPCEISMSEYLYEEILKDIGKP